MKRDGDDLESVRKRSRIGEYDWPECDICGKQFARPSQLKIHKLCHSEERPFSCEHCDSSFKNRSNLSNHINSVHLQRKRILCEICNMKFLNKSMLKKHMISHTDTACCCIKCRKVLKAQSLKDHQCRECSICSAVFILKSELAEHTLSHPGNEMYKCSDCGKTFKSQKSLTRHKIIHRPSEPHKCDICGLILKDKNTFKAHLLVHSEYTPFKCEICHKHFKRKGGLKLHMETHEEREHFTCQKCGCDFLLENSLNRHKLQCGVFKCTCKREFKTIEEIKAHSCDPDRKFRCKVCGFGFKRKAHLNGHMTTHAETKRLYSCDLCNEEFTTELSVLRHKVRKH